jgi:hypothetical protein
MRVLYERILYFGYNCEKSGRARPQVPIPQTAAEVPGPALGPMTKADGVYGGPDGLLLEMAARLLLTGERMPVSMQPRNQLFKLR